MTILTQLRASGRLPQLSPLALELWRMAEDTETPINDFTVLIESDPAIAARVVQTANSAAMGAGHPVADVRQAVIRLGTRAVAGLALATSMITRYRTGRCLAFDYDAYWRECVIRGLTARQLAPAGVSRDEAFTVGLLSQIGRLALATAFPSEYGDALAQVDQQCTVKLVDVERRLFQIDHNRLAAVLFADWGLPEAFSAAVLIQDGPHKSADDNGAINELARALYIGGFVAPLFVEATPHRPQLVNLLVAAHRVNIPRDDVPSLFDTIRGRWHGIAELLPIVPHTVGTWQEIYAATAPVSGSRVLVGARSAEQVWGKERTAEWFMGQ